MSINVASRTSWDPDGLIKEINQPNVKAVIYFFSVEFERFEPHKAFKRAFPHAACIGSSMMGGWCTTGAVEKGVVAMSLSSDEVEEAFVSLQEGVKTDPALAARKIIEELKRKLGYHTFYPNTYLGLVFFDGLCRGEEIIRNFTFEKAFNLNLIGGAAADELAFAKTLVSADERCSDDGVVVMVLKMKIPFHCNHYVHCLPTNTSFVITKSDMVNRIIWEIDGQHAAEYYAKVIGVSDVNKLGFPYFARNPLGIIIGDTVYIRAMEQVVHGTALKTNCSVEEGTRMYLLRRGDIIAQARKSLEEVVQHQYLTNIQGALLFNCALRYLELQEINKITEFNRLFERLSFVGFN
ncbi:MAG: FIST C-terminal domain-containing protein, partial [Treponema sp.]|nr:FIST C-terminal domain-containing protein [Treponema sp.]